MNFYPNERVALCAVEDVQRQRRRFTIVSTLRTSPLSIPEDLRRQADGFIDIYGLAPAIARKKK